MTLSKDHNPGPSGHEVQVAGAVKRYGSATALAGVDLSIAPGTFLVLLGRSGSGKSTLARALAGVERLDAGEIRLGDALVSAGRRHLPPERRNLAMVFQDYALWPHLTALGNVAYALRRRHLGAGEETRRAHEALERVGLGGLAGRYPHELSGGEQQRVALARAVVARPGLLIFDEPLSNLDADLRERLRVEIATLTRESEATAVYITHDQSEAFALADMIAVLDRGRLVQLGTPEDIYDRPLNAFVARFTGLAGELPGRVVSVADGEAVVATASSRVRARCDTALKPGAYVVVLVRPAATTLTAPSGADDGLLTGTVIDVAYRGRGYDHVIACEAGTLSAVFDTRAHPRGSTVHVTLDPNRTMAHATGQLDGPSAAEELTAVTIGT